MEKLKYLFLLFLLTACIQPDFNQVRIVDEYGKPAKINKIIPAFNEQQMLKQKKAFNDSITEVNKFRQDFNDIENNDITNLQNINNDSNIIEVSNNKQYPDDIFADRITNYKYLSDNKNIQVIDKNDKKEYISVKEENLNKVIQTQVVENNKTKIKENNSDIKSTTNKNKPINKQNNSLQFNNINSKGFYIQIGIFNEKINAENSYKKYSKIHKGGIDEYISKSKVKYKVLLGPYSNRNTAEKDLEKVIKTGHYDVYITEKK